MTDLHAHQAPSDWIRRWAPLIPDRAGGTRVLDLACGAGRHSRWLARHGHLVTAVDRDAAALAGLADLTPWVQTLQADLEQAPWPLDGRLFEAVVVTNYLWRPLWPHLLASLAPGGLLLYETFSSDQAQIGKPSRPDFLLQPGELLQRCETLRVVAYEDGFLTAPDRHVQRVAAVRPAPLPDPPTSVGPPIRYKLHSAG